MDEPLGRLDVSLSASLRADLARALDDLDAEVRN